MSRITEIKEYLAEIEKDFPGIVSTFKKDMEFLLAELETAQKEISRCQKLPALTWAQVTAFMVREFASLARNGHQGMAKEMLETLDKGTVHVSRLEARIEELAEKLSWKEAHCQGHVVTMLKQSENIGALRNALEFYAEPLTWVSNSGKVGIMPIDTVDRENIPGSSGSPRWVGGKKARETLTKIDKG